MADPTEIDALATGLVHHHDAASAGPGPALVAYAESSRAGDWSLRSALVRFAQPQPALAGAVLELVRRTDGALHPHRRLLESDPVATCPELDAEILAMLARHEPPARPIVADARITDLARLVVRHPDGATLVDAYDQLRPLTSIERELVAVLAVAVELDAIADVLTSWADDDDRVPIPDAAVEALAASAFHRLGAAGVPRERGR